MEVHSSSSKALCGDLNSIDELEDTLSVTLLIQDAHESSEVDVNSDIGEGNRYKDLKVDEIKCDQKSLSKCATFPGSDKTSPPSDATTDEEDEDPLEENLNHLLDMNQTCTRSISLPALSSPELVSAMKGSREKHGTPPKKMTVSWASDVYDPTPTIVSHTVKGKKQQKQWSCKAEKGNKKKGKNKEKANKVSRGSSSKEKKQFRRMAGGYGSLDARERSIDPDNGFNVGSPDSYCGGSFLRQSLTKVHMSVTEAL